MSSVCLSTFGLHDDVPEPAPDPEWHALVRQHAQTLAGMLQRLQTAVAVGQRRPDALRLQALVAAAEQLLTVQAQQHVRLERALVTDVSPVPAALTQRVQGIERAPIASQRQTRIALQYA